MATYTLLTTPFQWQPTLRIPRSRTPSFTSIQATRGCFISHSSKINTKALQTPSFKVRSSAASHPISASLFDEDNQKKFYILGGERSVGKTNSAASLAVKFADHGHPTFLVSLNPIRSLSDIFDQDLTDEPGIEGLKSSLTALEVNLKESKVNIKDYMDALGLGDLIEQFAESKIECRLASASQHEPIAIWKQMLLYGSRLFSNLDMRVVFDASLMDGQILNFFGNPDKIDVAMFIQDPTDITRLSENNLKKAEQLVRGSTEYIITTIPTVTAVKETARVYDILNKENVYVRRLIVNRILSPSSAKFSSMNTEDELLARWMVKNDPEFSSLDLIEAPLVDFEMRGIPALQRMGDMLWK